jgi:hypothetical protein
MSASIIPSWERRCGYCPYFRARGENHSPACLNDNGGLLHHPLEGVVVEFRYLSIALCCHRWASSDPVSRHFRRRGGAFLAASYLINMTMSLPLSTHVVCWQDRHSTAQSERACGPLRRQLTVCGETSSGFTRRHCGTSS